MSDQSAAVPKKIRVQGVLAVPPFTQTTIFPSSTSLKVVLPAVWKPIQTRYKQLLGVEPVFGEVEIASSVTGKASGIPNIGDLASKTDSMITITYELKDAEIFAKLAADAAEGRAALAENVVLTSQKSKKKRGKTGLITDGMDMEALLAQVLENNQTLTKQVQALTEQYQDTTREVRDVKEENRTLVKRMEGLENEVGALKKETCTLVEKVVALEKTTQALHRRAILDQARDKLLDTFQLNRYNFATAELLLSAVEQNVKSLGRLTLSHEALDLIFLSSSIRGDGNAAAHEASIEYLGIAVLSASLTEAKRKTLREIYKFVNGTEPSLGEYL